MFKRTLLLVSLLAAILVLDSRTFAADGMSDGPLDSISLQATIPPTETIADAQHVAAGVALRNKTSGTIALRGVPNGSTVAKAVLYWNFSDASATGAANSQILFNGSLLTGTKVADNPDPCWGNTGNHTYKAPATAYVAATRPNQDYVVAVVQGGSTTGQNPWNPSEAQNKRFEGATLVVVYKSANTVGDVVVLYDALSATMFMTTGTFTLNHAALSGAGLFTMSGADGQLGSGFDSESSNETTTFNGAQIAGPPVTNSDWDGSAGWPLPQLWDVHTHEVTLSGLSSTVVYNTVSDCLVPVVFVLQEGL